MGNSEWKLKFTHNFKHYNPHTHTFNNKQYTVYSKTQDGKSQSLHYYFPRCKALTIYGTTVKASTATLS